MSTKLDRAYERGGVNAVYDEIISWGQAISRAAQEADHLQHLKNNAQKKCGGCRHWMIRIGASPRLGLTGGSAVRA